MSAWGGTGITSDQLVMYDELQPLPETAGALLKALDAPPRLVAHLTLVHDMAYRLTEELHSAWPAVAYDRELVLLGAATHDIGKVIHRKELSGPGNLHEEAGPPLLREHGFPEAVCRIASTHGRWHTAPLISLEDLLVALADAVWCGRRDTQLEEAVVTTLVKCSREEKWSVHLRLDDMLTRLTEGAERRVLWQASHPS